MRLLILFLFLLVGCVIRAQESKARLVRESDALAAAEEQTKLHVPAGFSVQLFASEPMINKPINMAFDARGRLWVSSTVEYPYAAAKERWADAQGSRVKDSRDAIKILEDTDGDGKADKVTDFADGLNIPTGVLPWHKPEDKDGCIAWSIPNIWYFADTDGDGKCDKREVLFGPLGYEKDTHGMCSSFRMGLDGWVYATHGFNNTSHLKAKPKMGEKAGPKMEDGRSKIGQDPISHLSSPISGEASLTLHSGNVFRFRPDGSAVELYSAGQVNPFGLCWDRYGNLYSADCHSNPITQLIRGACYPSFGKPHDGLGFGPVMCEHSHGSTGLCGIIYIDGGIWGPEWDDHMFLGNCVTSKVNHDKITFTGSTPKANEQPDFITSDDLWFRPVDLQLGPDNALYIADFYNKIIGHYEVALDHPGRDKERGRIWRITHSEGVSPSPATPSDLALVTQLRHIVANGIDKRDEVTAQLTNASPQVQRWAATALQTWPDKASQTALLNALRAATNDPSLQHSVKLALREHLRFSGAFAAVSNNDRALITDIAKAVPTSDAAEFLFAEWKSKRLTDASSSILGIIARRASTALIEQMITEARARNEGVEVVASINEGLMESGIKPPPALLTWAAELAESLLAARQVHESQWTNVAYPSHPKDESPWCLQERKCADGKAVKVISSLDKDKRSPEKLTGILRSKAFAAPAKLSFWICGHQGFPKDKANHKNAVRLTAGSTTVREAFPPRNDVCQRVEWELAEFKGKEVRLEVVDGDDGQSYAWLGITRIEPAVVSIESFTSDDQTQKQLKTLATILRTTAPVGLRDKLAAYLPKPANVTPAKPQPEIDALIATRRAGFAKAKPDATKGELVFKANCAVCHSIKGQGGVIGPQLDGVGNRGADRLIEDILDPNRNVDAHFHLHQIKLRGDTMLTGFVRGEVGQVMIVVDAANNEQRISKGDVVEDNELPQSLMPPTFGQMIPPDAFDDLIAWLLK